MRRPRHDVTANAVLPAHGKTVLPLAVIPQGSVVFYLMLPASIPRTRLISGFGLTEHLLPVHGELAAHLLADLLARVVVEPLTVVGQRHHLLVECRFPAGQRR